MAVDLSYLQPYFEALNAVPHLLNQQQQASDQQDQLAESKRHDIADEQIAGRHADVAEGAAALAKQNQDLQNALTIRNNGFKPLTTGDDGQLYDPSAGGAPMPGAVGVTQGMGTPVTSGVANVGGQNYQIPTWEEQHARTLQQGIDDHQAENAAALNSRGWQIPDEMADTLGITKGSKVLPEHVGALVQLHNTVSPPDKQFAPVADKPTVKLTAQDAKLMGVPAGTEMPLEEYKARTASGEALRARRGDGGAANPDDKPLTTAQRINVTRQYAEAQWQSGIQLQKDREAAQKTYMASVKADPASEADAAKQRVADLKSAAAAHKGRLQQAVGTYETQSRQQSHDPWADNMSTEVPTEGATAPVKQLTDPKIAGDYLQKAGGDKDKARKLAAADNWKF